MRRLGRVLNGVERILAARGWIEVAAAGITASVVNSGSGRPGDGWVEVWNMNPKDAREDARASLRLLTLGPDGED